MRPTPVDALTARCLGLALPLVRETLQAAQMAALRATVHWTKAQSPLYRERLSTFDPDSLVEPSDLERLPFLRAGDLSGAPQDLLCLSQSRIARIITLETSGSTGPAKRLFFTPEDLAATSEFFFEGMLSLISGRDRVMILLPASQPDGVGDLLLRALAGQGVECFAVWPLPAVAALVEEAAGGRVTSVVGLPLPLLALAEALPCPSHIKSMLLCSDYAPAVVRKRIEMACGCKTFLHYGATETGLGGGVECGVHQGCHLREADLLVEIVAPDGTEPLADGELGEVVITTLRRRGMPLLRYRTGDLARLDRSPCRCGGMTARLCDIRGRRNGCRFAGGPELFSQDLDDALFTIAGLLDFRASLFAGEPDRLQVEYLQGRGYSDLEPKIRRALRGIAAVRQAVENGRLVIWGIQAAQAFTASHTMKRSIQDRRE